MVGNNLSIKTVASHRYQMRSQNAALFSKLSLLLYFCIFHSLLRGTVEQSETVADNLCETASLSNEAATVDCSVPKVESGQLISGKRSGRK